MSRFSAILLILAGSWSYSSAAATLYDVCGPPGTKYSDPNSQFAKYCQAGLANQQEWVKDDNGFRVWLPVAVVCGYGCLAPGQSGSLCGTSQASCGLASRAGYKAYSLNVSSQSSLGSAKNNGQNAQALTNGNPLPQTAPTPSLDASACGRAIKSQGIKDRIECAAGNDSELPAFIRDPRFAAEFEKITGKPLEQIINQSGTDLAISLGVGAVEHAYGNLKGKVTYDQFQQGMKGIVGGVLKSLPSDAERVKFVNEAIPLPLRPLIVPPRTFAYKFAPIGTKISRDVPNYAAVPPGSSASEPDNEMSIFERVSARYRLVQERLGQ